ncbi:Serine/threonine-protein kinase ppk18 [Schizosaccharomyces pombe]
MQERNSNEDNKVNHGIDNIYVLELDLDGSVLFASTNFSQITGISSLELTGKPAALLSSDQEIFNAAIEQLLDDDSHSVKIHTVISKLPSLEENVFVQDEEMELQSKSVELDCVGVLIRDPLTSRPSHTLWVLQPLKPTRITRQEIGQQLTETLGFGAQLLAQHLEKLQTVPSTDSLPPFETVLCRVCDHEIQNWYFEHHTELCLLIHHAEARAQEANDLLNEQRNALQSLLDSLDDQIEPDVSYLGVPLAAVLPSSITSSAKSNSRSSLSQKIRNYISNMLFDAISYTDSCLAIHLPFIPESTTREDNQPFSEIRLLSPASEVFNAKTLSWCLPHIDDPGLQLMFENTDALVKKKLDAINRLSNIIYYSERVRCEIEDQVQTIIEQSIQVDGYDEPLSTTTPTLIEPIQETLMTQSPIIECEPFNTVKPSVSPEEVHDISQFNHRNDPPITAASVDSSNSFSVHRSSTNHSSTNSGSPNLSRRNNLAIPIASRRKSVSAVNTLYGVGSSYTSESFPFSKLTVPVERNSFRETESPKPFLSRQIGISTLSSNISSGKGTPSIQDYEIIKPISKGTFGTVYLSRKNTTGEIYAIKVLRKVDMISKNQVANVKAERAVLMAQEESAFVAKLYYAFQSRDYLYLVMEFMNGGDCASLLKSLYTIPESWAKIYIAEVALGLEHLHRLGIIHRDIKPDNILMSITGHLKLADFGLSQLGLTTRQLRLQKGKNNVLSPPSFQSPTALGDPGDNIASSPLILPTSVSAFSYDEKSQKQKTELATFTTYKEDDTTTTTRTSIDSISSKYLESPVDSQKVNRTPNLQSVPFFRQPDAPKRFVGTPDYLAPETLRGSTQDDMVDWWALGCVLFEFLFGYPPFHAETPEKVFENILANNIAWPDLEMYPCSEEALDLINGFLQPNPERRLGFSDINEIKEHPFFNGINWDDIFSHEAPFIPAPETPLDTAYFDSRGAGAAESNMSSSVNSGEEVSKDNNVSQERGSQFLRSSHGRSRERSTSARRSRRFSEANSEFDEFGPFSYKNLSVLERANRNAIEKIRSEIAGKLHISPPDPHIGYTPGSDMPSAKLYDQQLTLSPSLMTNQGSNFSSTDSTPRKSINSSDVESRSKTDGPKSMHDLIKQLHMRKHSSHTNQSTGSSESDDLFNLDLPISNLETSYPFKIEEGQASPLSSPLSKTPPFFSSSVPLKALICVSKLNLFSELIKLLKSYKFQVSIVTDEDKMLRTLMADEKFSIIFLQLDLTRVSGVSILKIVRSSNCANRNTPAIALTPTRIDINAAIPRMFDGRLYLPINAFLLRGYIARLCNK